MNLLTLLSSSPQREQSAIQNVVLERICLRLQGKDSMEQVCKNCDNFVQKTFESSRYLWGDCTKGAISIGTDGKKEQAAFVWADKNCSDFKPRQVLKSSQHSVWAG